MSKLLEQDNYFKARSSSCLGLPNLNIKKELKGCPVTSFQLCFRECQQFLEMGILAAWSLLPLTQPEKQCFIYWASPELSFEQTVSPRKIETPWSS